MAPSRAQARKAAEEGGNADGELPPIKSKSVKVLTLDSLKRSHDLFVGNHGMPLPLNDDGERAKIACKIRAEYAALKDMPPPAPAPAAAAAPTGAPAEGEAPGGKKKKEKEVAPSAITELLDTMPESAEDLEQKKEKMQLSVYKAPLPDLKGGAQGGRGDNFSAQIMKRIPSKWPRPVWHAPWKLYRVISGHLGWVRSVAVEPGNEWFVTGSADRTIKIWDLASGQLKLTLTGHIEQVTGLAVSPRHPYMFSCGLDKTVKCWDLEYNKVIRHYHGHLSGVYDLALHPTLDVLFTGGRDSTCRVWDMRTKQQVHCLSGHDNTVCSIITQPTDPQVVTGSHDATIKTWDLAAGKCQSTLTYHKKSVRAMVMHPTDYAFASASADNIKKFKLPEGTLLHNMLAQQKAIVNCMAVNEDGVMATGGDNGSMWFWDWKSGHNFQQHQTQVQPGSLESESGLFAMDFDRTGTRLITCEADKTVKMYKEDPDATEETHPLSFRPPSQMRRW